VVLKLTGLLVEREGYSFVERRSSREKRKGTGVKPF